MIVKIASIKFNYSLVDGPGLRSVLFFQGCPIKCRHCHNKDLWDIENGSNYDIDELCLLIENNALNKKLTITGGEPLFQIEALSSLLQRLDGYDICLYTGYDYETVPEYIIPYLSYIKVGPFDYNLRCSTTSYIGSLNQRFINLKEVNHVESK